MREARRLVGDWLDVLLVVGAAVVGLALAGPVGALVDHHAIDVVLFVLVLAAALTIPMTSVLGLRRRAPRLLLIEGLTVACLPLIAWAAAQLVADGPVRLGVIAVGVAPAEIATVALTTLALGETAVAAALLVASTVFAALVAGPILGLLVRGAEVHTGPLVATLALVVVLPFGLGLAVRARSSPAVEGPAGRVATGAVVVLVALVASQVDLDATLARAVVALVVIIAAGALLGAVLGRLVEVGDRSAVLLSTSMRDFAVAAGIASAAFGSAAAAPLGVYGILVMVWGATAATRARRRTPNPA